MNMYDNHATQRPLLSVVIASYNMNRELPRTLFTMREPYQRGIEDWQLEIIVVDNGSDKLCDIPLEYSNVKHIKIENPSKSPAQALNLGIKESNSDFICAMIDGARMVSPGMFYYALKARELNPRVVVSTLGFHLGTEVQMKSILKGYNAQQEDLLLEKVNWKEDGYQLFRISTFAGSSATGWFLPIAESNALFMPRGLWQELEGFDERFITPGGGLVNLDLYKRACELPNIDLITLFGEGTFHQFHGGVATNQPVDNWKLFHDEYVRIRGKQFTTPQKKPILFGGINHNHKYSVLSSLKHYG